MQHELTETPDQVSRTDSLHVSPSPSSQHGSRRSPPDVSGLPCSRSSSPRSVLLANGVSIPVDADQLDHRLRRSRHATEDSVIQTYSVIPGQHIANYEQAHATNMSRPTPGVGVKKRQGSPSNAVKFTDFPNEILTHILSHLPPDSHLSVGLVSKRFYALVTNPHLWRTAFFRYFPAQDAILGARGQADGGLGGHGDNDTIRSENRSFVRLTSLASWRSEYLLRTRLLRSVARGKPGTVSGGIGSPSKPGSSGKKASAVLTYNSKLPWMVSNIHAAFAIGKKPPRVISGTAELGVSTVSDPTTGRIEKWGLDDPFAFAQINEMFPNLEPYGLDDDGPAAVPNVMDVSQSYGVVGGEGFPGGRAHYKATNELRGRYLGRNSDAAPAALDSPRIPELSEAVSAVWIAKSPSVPFATQSMVGIMTGSTLGIITTYAIAPDSSGRRYANGDMTARWAISPGVPIVALRVDDGYNSKRKALGRVWAVALNALGEVFYLKQTPTLPTTEERRAGLPRAAWNSGRTVSWHLIESTRRTARPDEFDTSRVRGAYSPRSASNEMSLSKEQITAEAREIEKFLRYKPAHFRKLCFGWDMRRKLEVDFAGGDGRNPTGENILVVTCGQEKGEPLSICRYSRDAVSITNTSSEFTIKKASSPTAQAQSSSLFGGSPSFPTPSSPIEPAEGTTTHPAPVDTASDGKQSTPDLVDDWRETKFVMKNTSRAEITAVGLDNTSYAVLAPFEDPLKIGPIAASSTSQILASATPPGAQSPTSDIPGRRSRLFAIGTSTGLVYVWNIRASVPSTNEVEPLRIVQTESPGISCVALSALYIVHGGSDGLVQIWDILASTLDPIRTVSSRSSGRLPRHIINANPALNHGNYTAIGSIFLDPDPTVLRGIISFGTFLRYWTYSSTSQPTGRKRRHRHSDIHGRLSGRRRGGVVSSYIAAEEAEVRREQEHRAREQARLRSRFGVGLNDLTEEEALRYAELISQEAFLLDEQRRLSASDTGSTADLGETASSAGSMGSSTSSTDTVTPEPSLSEASPPAPSLPVLEEEEAADDDYEAQIQRAIRLSLMEGTDDTGGSPRGNSSVEFDFPVHVKGGNGSGGKNKKGRESTSSTPPSYANTWASPSPRNGPAWNSKPGVPESSGMVDADEDLELALRLSLQEEGDRQRAEAVVADAEALNDFPPLETVGKGKGKGKAKGW